MIEEKMIEEQRSDNINFGGAIGQKLEHIKSRNTLWNEYFTANLHYVLNMGQVYTTEHRENTVRNSANIADIMLEEYDKRFGNGR